MRGGRVEGGGKGVKGGVGRDRVDKGRSRALRSRNVKVEGLKGVRNV